MLQGLQELELVLETFPVKKSQLDTVVECAKAWKFPLQDTQWELTYDDVKLMDWTKVPEDRASDREPHVNAGEQPPKRQRRQISGKVQDRAGIWEMEGTGQRTELAHGRGAYEHPV